MSANGHSPWWLFVCLSAILHVLVLGWWHSPPLWQIPASPDSPLTITLLDSVRPPTHQADSVDAESPPPKKLTPAQRADTATLKSPHQTHDTPEAGTAAQGLNSALAEKSSRPSTVDTATDSLPADLLAEIERQLRRHISLALAKHFDYPRRAQRHGWQGTVILDFNVETDGQLTNISIANSSRFSILDRAAKASLSSIERVDPVLVVALQQRLSLQLPVIYRLE